VPYLGLEPHDRRSEGVLARDLDVYMERATLERCVWRSKELAAQMCKVIAISCRLNNHLGVLVVLNVRNLLGNAPVPVGSHCGCAWRVDLEPRGRVWRNWQQVGNRSVLALEIVSLRLCRRQVMRGSVTPGKQWVATESKMDAKHLYLSGTYKEKSVVAAS
jgi:hypothetical protein